jgi:hypothetical protein
MATQVVHNGNRVFPRWHRLLTAFGTALLLLGTCCWGAWYGLANNAVFWEVPADYRGWAVLEWDNPACPALPRRGLSRIVTVDATGYVCTVHGPDDVPSGGRVFLIYADGRREELRSQDYAYDGVQAYFGFTHYPGDGSHRYSATFIGTANGFSTEPRPAKCATPARIKNACIP